MPARRRPAARCCRRDFAARDEPLGPLDEGRRVEILPYLVAVARRGRDSAWFMRQPRRGELRQPPTVIVMLRRGRVTALGGVKVLTAVQPAIKLEIFPSRPQLSALRGICHPEMGRTAPRSRREGKASCGLLAGSYRSEDCCCAASIAWAAPVVDGGRPDIVAGRGEKAKAGAEHRPRAVRLSIRFRKAIR